MLRVYFDGSIESAGQVVAACRRSNTRVFVVAHRRLTHDEAGFLERMRDCGGTLGAWKGGMYRAHRSYGSARRCVRVVPDGVAAFFEDWTDDERVDGERREARLLGLRTCDRYTCRTCDTCARVAAIAAVYGVYDLFDAMAATT